MTMLLYASFRAINIVYKENKLLYNGLVKISAVLQL